MAEPAPITALPGLLRATREAVEAYAPTGSLVALRWTLLGLLIAAEITAERIVDLLPLAAMAGDAPPHHGPWQVSAPLSVHVPAAGTLGGWPPPTIWPESDGPLVPRRTP